jgi:hypothetical protein
MVTMQAGIPHRGRGKVCFWAALLLSPLPLRADPIVVGPGSIFEFGTLFAITTAVLVEATCILLLLRRWRTPRLFILWIAGMHLLTYPAFLGLLWLSVGMRPELAIVIGEAMIVLIEGSLIYLMCCFAPSAKLELPLPSVNRSLLASLVGNICSILVFPLLAMLFGVIASFLETFD